MTLRYVVHHHEGIPQPHYDFMFETAPGLALTTFRIIRWPVESGDQLERLPDHRAAYLDYEGPVSGNRGNVRRIDRGQLDILTQSDTEWLLRINSGPLLRLTVAAPHWRADIPS